MRTWRRELIRGGVLFGLVVGAGVAISRIRVDMPDALEMLSSFGEFDLGEFGHPGDLFGPGRETGDPWEFRSPVTPAQQVWIRNMNGPVEVTHADGSTLEVLAEKSWRHTSPEAVEIVAVPTARGVTICALWAARERRCEDGGDYKVSGVSKTDVAVRFHVRLPRGVRLDASTINGDVAIDSVSAPVEAATINGDVDVRTAVGPVRATTKNGAVRAFMASWTEGDVELETVNGSVTVALPEQVTVRIDASTVNGRVRTDLPVQVSGKLSPRQLRGTIGPVDAATTDHELPLLEISTVNGSITIAAAHAMALPPRTPRAPRPPRPARPARVEQR
ncbi:MAG: DUF4097 family beta strand repeat-containing protein, partial [Gemmatimonadales bacterium]